MSVDYRTKVRLLHERLSALPGAVVAFSGGVDSAMLLHACRLALGDNVLAVTAESPSLPAAEREEAVAFTAERGIPHRLLQTQELERTGYRKNGRDRCFFCKDELFEVVADQMRELLEQDWPVLYGAIADDLQDHRPGAKAADRHGVLAPLAEVGMTKEDVRRFSREHDLPTADKPSFACLSSRVPYGTPIDAELLSKLEAAEAVLRELGFAQFRVRHHDSVARIELLPEDFDRAVKVRERIVEGIKAAGYKFVSLDLVGFRSGSMNA